MKTSARNMFVGQISSIRQGMVVCEVELTTSSGLKIVSAITKKSLENAGPGPGQDRHGHGQGSVGSPGQGRQGR